MHCGTRYLIFFQYIGTKYSGVMKVNPHQRHKKGVQNYMEDAIRKLKPVNPVSLFISSRTDSGVHALCNSAHFDLQRRGDLKPFSEDVLVEALNYYLSAEQIRITHAHRVPHTFHARLSAESRTYVYRIAQGASRHLLLPLSEQDMCWHVCNTDLDVGAMREAAALLVGQHNFDTFRAVSSDMPFKSPIKTLDVVDVQPGSYFLQTHFRRNVSLWELKFRARSFLYRQVRRMTGALVAVGQGRISVPQMKDILEAQNTLAFPQGLTAPPHGLFLTSVDYKDADLQFSPQMSEEQHGSTGIAED